MVRTPRSLLIIECEAAKLARQGIDIAGPLFAFLRPIFGGVPIHLIRATTQAELLSEMHAYHQSGGAPTIVVVVGHANEHGVRLASDGPLTPWAGFAEWLRPFSPRELVLAACEAGRWLPCKELFMALPNLRVIYGSPVTLNQNQAHVLQALVAYRVAGGRVTAKKRRWAQAINLILTGGVVFHRTRQEYQRSGDPNGVIERAFEQFLGHLVPGVREIVSRIWT